MSKYDRVARGQALDRRLGLRVRAKRHEARMTLATLAEHLDLTYQQVQKYEAGDNRISAVRLYEIGLVLGVGIEAFYEGLPMPSGAAALQARNRERIDALLATPGGQDLLEAFLALPPRLQRPIVDLARGMAHHPPHATPALLSA